MVGVSLLAVGACSDSDYDEKYADPSKTSTVNVANVFTGIEYTGHSWMDPMYYRYYVQSTTSGIFSGVIADYNTNGRFMGAGEGYFNTRWQNFYNMLTQYRVLQNTYNNLSDELKEENLIFVYLGRTLVESQLHEMLSLFGDVPFSGAGTLLTDGYEAAKNNAVYDDDVTLYRQILADLKEVGDYFAAGNLNANGTTALSRQDYSVAASSTSLWQKYVNSLRLRIALHLATNGDLASEAQSAIAEILNNPTTYPLIDSNSENMGVTANTSNDNFNFGKGMSQALRTGTYAGGSTTMLNAMNVPSNGIPDENTDPRLAAIYDCNPDGEYIAPDINMSNTEISNLSQQKVKEYQDRNMLSNYFCEIDTVAIAGWASYQGNENLFGLWLGAAEVSLSKAEAYLMGYGVAKNETLAKEYFIKGVKESINYYWDEKQNSSLFSAGNDSYQYYRQLVVPTDEEIAAYAEKIWQPTQETVCTQLWLNFGYMNELEAWNVVRRTGYPVVTFRRDNQNSDYGTPPNRLPYPSDEINFNSANYQEARKINYEEETGYYTNLFWAKKVYYKLLGE